MNSKLPRSGSGHRLFCRTDIDPLGGKAKARLGNRQLRRPYASDPMLPDAHDNNSILLLFAQSSGGFHSTWPATCRRRCAASVYCRHSPRDRFSLCGYLPVGQEDGWSAC